MGLRLETGGVPGRLTIGGSSAILSSEGGVEVGDVDAKAKKLLIPVDGSVSTSEAPAQSFRAIKANPTSSPKPPRF